MQLAQGTGSQKDSIRNLFSLETLEDLRSLGPPSHNSSCSAAEQQSPPSGRGALHTHNPSVLRLLRASTHFCLSAGSSLLGFWIFWPLFHRFFNSSQTSFYFQEEGSSWSLSKLFTHSRQKWVLVKQSCQTLCLLSSSPENLIKLLLQNTLDRTLRGLADLPMGYRKVKTRLREMRTFSRSACSLFCNHSTLGNWASLVAEMVKNLPTVLETTVWSLGQEAPLKKGMATNFSILA